MGQMMRRTFEVIDDGNDNGQNDLVKRGNASDQRDMARMGKLQEMRVRSVCLFFLIAVYIRSRKC